MAVQLFESLGEGAVVKATVIEVAGRRVVDLSSRERHECQLQQVRRRGGGSKRRERA